MRYTVEQFINTYNNVTDYPMLRDVANALGISLKTVKNQAAKFRQKGMDLLYRSQKNIPESETIFRENYTAEDCIEELRRLQNANQGKDINRVFYRNETKTSDSTWNRYFGTFDEFKRQAGLTLTRSQQRLEKQIAVHASRDQYEAFNEERRAYEGKYLRPNKNRFKTLLIASDLHDIDCDKFFLRVMTDVAKRAKPDVFVFGGDLFDLPEFGKYTVDPREWDVVKRINFVHKEILKPLREVIPNTQIDLIEGNHECISPDTEVLTDRGWMRARHLHEGFNIASYPLDGSRIDFNPPLALRAFSLVESCTVRGLLSTEDISLSHKIDLDGELKPVKQFLGKNIKVNRKRLALNIQVEQDAPIMDDDVKYGFAASFYQLRARLQMSRDEFYRLLSQLSKRQLELGLQAMKDACKLFNFKYGRYFTSNDRASREALQTACMLNGMVAELRTKSLYIYDKIPQTTVQVKPTGRQTVVAIQTKNGTLITRNEGVINFTGNCRLIKHLADATPALRAVLSDLHGFTISKLLGLDEFEINYIAKADLKAWTKRDENKEIANNYKVYYDSFLVHHLPQARDMGMPGCHGHHHKHIVWSAFSPNFGTYEWHQLGCGHKRSASYCEGEKWGIGFALAHIDTQTRATAIEYIPITDFAVAGGKWYQRHESEPAY